MASNSLIRRPSFLQRASRSLFEYALFGPKHVQYRSSLENPQTPLSFPAEWLLDIFNGGRTDSGIRVSEMTALQVSTVLACINIVSQGIASLPCNVTMVEQQAGRTKKTIAHDHPLFDTLRMTPNIEMTSHTFTRTMQAHAMLWGNAYAEITRDNAGRVHSLWPRNPSRIRPVRLLSPTVIEGTRWPTGYLIFKTEEGLFDQISDIDENPSTSSMTRYILPENIIHIPGLSLDGRIGQSTVWLARQIFGLSLATEKFAAKFFGNGAVPRGIISLSNNMEAKAIEELKRQWAEAYGGENAHKIAVLTAGQAEYKPIGTDADKSQLIEARKFQREEIASIFNVPGHMVGVTGAGTKSNVEQASIEFLTFCIAPWLNTWEQEYDMKLFPKVGRNSGQFTAMFDTHRLFYPDAASRSVFYNGGKQWGYLSTNDIHELENMNPVGDPSGEKYWMPVNMQTMDDPVNLGQEAQFEFNKTHPAPPTAIPHLFPGGPTSTTPPSGMPKSPNPASAKVISTSPKPQAGGTGRAMIASYSRGFTRLFDDNIGKIVQRGATKEQDFNRIWSPILHTVVDTIVAANTLIENQTVRGADETMLAYAQRIYVARSTDNTSEKYEKQIKDFIVGLKARSVDWTAMNKTMIAETEARYALVYFDTLIAAEDVK